MTLEEIFNTYMLIGSVNPKPDVLKKLLMKTKKNIDTVIKDPNCKLTSVGKMQVAFVLINLAKEWDSEKKGNFWEYICSQFSWRDGDVHITDILKDALETTMKGKGKLFVEDQKKHYKSTVLMHALHPKKSWWALFDFLFNFYKNNLKWRSVPNDPLIPVMVAVLRRKMANLDITGEDSVNLVVSSHCYSFQVGIRKLILLAPEDKLIDLFGRLIANIDGAVRRKRGWKRASIYEDQLCDEWFRTKLKEIVNQNFKRKVISYQDEIATDYTRIQVKYLLKNEKEFRLVIPDVRLKNNIIERPMLTIHCGNHEIFKKNMSYYGDEYGRTLIGDTYPLNIDDIDGNVIEIRATITCDGTVLYDSEDTLYRRIIFFLGEREVRVANLKRDSYTIISPTKADLDIENTEVTEIDDFPSKALNACFVEFHKNFMIRLDGRLIFLENEQRKDINIILPKETEQLPHVMINESEYSFSYKGSRLTIVMNNVELSHQYRIKCNENFMAWDSLSNTSNGMVFELPLVGTPDESMCHIQIVNLENEKLIFDKRFILVGIANGGFNREFYYSLDDYKGAEYKIDIDGISYTSSFTQNDDIVRIPYGIGEIYAMIPRITLEETSGTWMDEISKSWYIENIESTSLFIIKSPSNITIRLQVQGESIFCNENGIVEIGNRLKAICNRFQSLTKNNYVDICMLVSTISNPEKLEQTYTLGSVYYKESFLEEPAFWTEEENPCRLYWNRGGGFIGASCDDTNRVFKLKICGVSKSYNLVIKENDEFIDIPSDMPIGNYQYELSILTNDLFGTDEITVATGYCVIGNKNELRFKDKCIQICFVTDMVKRERINIHNCYIDQIKFKGIENVDKDGLCPVYEGIMYAKGENGERYNLSFKNCVNRKGIKKYAINPVYMAYLGNNTLSITDQEKDGLYYCYFHTNGEKIYTITDRECIPANKHRYSNPEFYLYEFV